MSVPLKGLDVAALRLTRETDAPKFIRFCEAIYTARRLGFDVTLRIVDDPRGEGRAPLDIYATATERRGKT